jgi:hypothetical protein
VTCKAVFPLHAPFPQGILVPEDANGPYTADEARYHTFRMLGITTTLKYNRFVHLSQGIYPFSATAYR